MLGALEGQKQIRAMSVFLTGNRHYANEMQKMQITAIQFQSKATLGNKSVAGLVMGEEGASAGPAHLLPAPQLSVAPVMGGQSSAGAVRLIAMCILRQLLKWGFITGLGSVKEKARAVLTGVRLGRLGWRWV